MIRAVRALRETYNGDAFKAIMSIADDDEENKEVEARGEGFRDEDIKWTMSREG